MLKANGATPEAVSAILAAFGVKHGESPVGEGQKIILLPEEPAVRGAKPRIARVSVYADDQLKATVAIDDTGAYAPVSSKAAPARKAKAADDGESGGMSLYQSLYETALKQGLAKPLIDALVRMFANDVDFQRATAAGDSVEAFFSEPDELNPRPELLYATMTVRDQTYKYYRFQTPDDNMVDYYDENGRSTRKFLMRKPIADGEMTSGFGMRYHPILHFTRMHTGVDWAAPIGTPILAAGNGVVIKAEWDSGYGRRVEIQHANGYVTTYNHMSGFGRGIAEGAHVTQGQVVGYLGQTGLATGPHLHYEVIINGNFVDPMAIKLARTREFDGKMLAAFRRERDRIDQLDGAGAVGRGGGERKTGARRRLRNSTERDADPAVVVAPKSERCANLRRGDALGAQSRKRRRSAGLRKLGSLGVKHQPVMAIARRGQTQQFLQKPMDRGRQEKVASAHDVGDALQRVVDRHRQMIARREVPAGEDDVSPSRRLGDALDRVRPFAELQPDDPGRRQIDRATHVEPERSPVASRKARRLFRSRRGRGRCRDRAARRRDRAPTDARAISALLQKHG